MSEVADDWRLWNEEARQHRQKNRDKRTINITEITAEMGIECKCLTEYHFRLSYKTRTGINQLDYYPTRNRIHIPSMGKWFTFSDKDLKNILTKYLLK